MSFTLRIRFSGLCLFTEQVATSTQPARMHVLMPLAAGSHLHIPVLQFDAAHLAANGTESQVVAQFPLKGYAFTIDGPSLDTAICSTIVDLRELTGRPVLPALYNSNPGSLLAARVTLTGGHMTSVNPGVTWLWVGSVRRLLAHVAEWEIELPGDAVRFRLQDIGGGTIPDIPELPLLIPNELNRVNVSIRHLPPAELSFEQLPPSTPAQADHVALYYPLFGGSAPTFLPTMPQACTDRPSCLPPKTCTEFAGAGESAFNCMLAIG